MKNIIFFFNSFSFVDLKAPITSTLRKISCVLIISFVFYGCTRSDIKEILADNSSKKILIDASHDGGAWWFPQSIVSGFSQSSPHQGKALADFLRNKGFIVEELPSYTLITVSLLQQYNKVIRAGSYGSYQESELSAYNKFLEGNSSLFLISDYKRPEETDQLAERLGIDFKGTYFGDVTLYAPHTITEGGTPFYYNAGSVVTNVNSNSKIQILAWLNGNSNQPVAGILNHPSSKIFFMGEINGIETVPQPLTNNIAKWLFE